MRRGLRPGRHHAGAPARRAGARCGADGGGGLDWSPESQDIYVGENVGLDYFAPDVTRLRYLGRTSNHWGGRCRPLDASDFLPRAENPLSGLPITKADLDPYQAGSAEILDLGPADVPPDQPLEQASSRFRRTPWRFSEPATRFGEKDRAELAASERISLCLNANLVDLRVDQDLATVTEAVFRAYGPQDPGFAVQARHYALCLGGLENPRFLLNCTGRIPEGIGHAHDLVGRYFQEHPHFMVGEVEFEAPRHEDVVECFSPTVEFMQAEGTLNFALFVRPEIAGPLPLRRALARSAICATPFTERLVERVRGHDTSCGRGGIGEYLERQFVEQGLTGRVRIVIEQSLIRDSRVFLGEERDDFGLRRLKLDWRLGALDEATIRVATRALGEHLAEQRIGRLKLYDWLLAEPMAFPGVEDRQSGGVAGQHHMGTTRMSDDPRRGVVDRNCRVHGIANLYIGGSSVFPTSGHANPTHTIVQLALRLGDHLGCSSNCAGSAGAAVREGYRVQSEVLDSAL